jgi:hypothetical protein
MPAIQAQIRRFRFNLPQGIAALMLGLFLLHGLWWMNHSARFNAEAMMADCGRALWSHPFTGPEQLPACGVLFESPLVDRMAALPLGPRWPFLAVGLLLGGALWWVTRRQFGNLGGYTALAFYCTSPLMLRASIRPSMEILAALAVYGGVFTLTGVAHAMQGPRRKWKPRLLLLAAILALAACTSIAALVLTLALGVVLMLWIIEGKRSTMFLLIGIALALSLPGVLVGSNFAPAALVAQGWPGIGLSYEAALDLALAIENTGLVLAVLAALALYLSSRRTRYFGHTAPLVCAAVLLALELNGAAGFYGTPACWAQPFLMSFLGGVFADGYEGRRGFLWKTAAIVLVLTQAAACVFGLVYGGAHIL